MNSSTVRSLLCVLSSLAWLLGRGYGADAAAFASPAAVRAQQRYEQSIAAASKRFTDELDRNMKLAVQAGALEEANQITEAKNQVAGSAAVTVDFKRQGLITARNMYRDALTAAKGQYFRDLEPALRDATKAGNLAEANAIDAVRKALASEVADGKVTGKLANGLLLTLGGKQSVWENKPVTLPSKQTAVTLEGVLLLSGKVRTVKLRSAKASGSERLKFTVDGKLCDFQEEGSNHHRYVVVTPQPGSDKLRLKLGDSIAANEWVFGPLEWSINDGQWREIPLRSLIAVD
ncbi:hypothetical protein [Prosthecobacter sp.]|uniref:hypothetical protein n=1 Tax=Prosthecobacter sp. TaxID=1965333 RepID=UPI003785017A